MDPLELEFAHRVAAGIRRVAQDLQDLKALNAELAAVAPPGQAPTPKPPARCCGSALDIFGAGTMAARYEAEHQRALRRTL